MNKKEIIDQVIAALVDSVATLEKAARASHAEATHESSKAEDKYDTRGLEAAYLAGGQARQAREILESIKTYQSLEARSFTPEDPIDLTALVVLQTDGVPSTYFIGPKSGGLDFELNGKEITVITPHSPLGQSLAGKKVGQQWSADIAGNKVKYRIVSVE